MANQQQDLKSFLAREKEIRAAGGGRLRELHDLMVEAFNAAASAAYEAGNGVLDDGEWIDPMFADWDSVSEAWNCGDEKGMQVIEREHAAMDAWQATVSKAVAEKGFAGVDENTRRFRNRLDAELQASILAESVPGGRWYVTRQGRIGDFEVRFDECKVRDGADESEILFEAPSHCNSGVRNYRENLLLMLGIPSFKGFLAEYEE